MRLVIEGIAQPSEIARWSVRKVFDYNELLDLREEAELKSAEARKDQAEAMRSE